MKKMTCLVCPNGCSLSIEKDKNGYKVDGNLCPKGREFALSEIINPKRTICSTVRTTCTAIRRLPVRTNGEIPKSYMMPVMDEINKVVIKNPVHTNDIIIKNVLGTGIDIIATSDMYLYM